MPNNHLKGRVVFIFAIVALTQTLYPSTENAPTWLVIGYQAMYLLLFVAGLLIVRDTPRTFWAMVVLGVIWLINGIVYALNPLNGLAQIGAYVAFALYQVMVIVVLLRFIFTTHEVTRDVIYAACTVYILFGAVFVGIYGALDVLTFEATGAHAFRDSLVPADAYLPWQNLVYYSYVVLATLGFGDILPVTMWARSLTTLEAVIGVLYLSIIVARLVGLYASKEVEEDLRR
jgi:hypothetical protein